MTDQHQHRATDERLRSAVRAQSKTVAHLSNRVEGLEKLHAAVVDLNERFNLDPLVARVKALELALRAQAGLLTTDEQTELGVMPASDAMDAAKRAAAGAQVGRSSPSADRMLALQDQIRDGSLTLAKALEKINGEPIERTWRTTYLVEKIRVKMIKEQKISNSWPALAEAVLREVAEWLRSEYPQWKGCGTAWANLLDNEANL